MKQYPLIFSGVITAWTATVGINMKGKQKTILMLDSDLELMVAFF